MKELQEVINAKVAEIIESGEIEKQISKRIESVIDSALETQFRSYGPIAKQLEKAFEDKLVIDTGNIDFESYNQIMLSAVKQRINGMFAESASSKFMKELDEMLDTPPKEIDIHDLVNQVAEFWRGERSSYDDWENEIFCELDADEGVLRGSYSLKMHIESCGYGSSKEKELHLYINKDGAIRISHRAEYNPTILSNAEGFIFKLYAAGTKLTNLDSFDPYKCDLSTGEDCDY